MIPHSTEPGDRWFDVTLATPVFPLDGVGAATGTLSASKFAGVKRAMITGVDLQVRGATSDLIVTTAAGVDIQEFQVPAALFIGQTIPWGVEGVLFDAGFGCRVNNVGSGFKVYYRIIDP